MATSYTSLLGLALPVEGELSGTWGDVVNDYITSYIDAAVAGGQVISGSQTAVTLSVTNGSALSQAGTGTTGSAQYALINCTGNPASLLTITAPASYRNYLILNSTSTSQSVKIVGAGPTTGVTVASGKAALVTWNGSDFTLVATNDISTMSGTLAVANGGTGQTSYTDGQLLIGNSTGNTLTKATLTQGTGITITNGSGAITIANASPMTYPGAGIPNSTGSAWGTSYTTTGSGTVVALATSPSFTTPTLGVASATTINKVTITTPATGSTLTIADGKTLTVNNSIALTGTDSTTMTFPSTSQTLAGLNLAQTFTATNTFWQVIYTVNTVTVSSNAGTVPITYRLNNFTNSSAATMTITMATASAVDGQMSIVRIYDASAVAQTITWVNTENSTVTAPTTSNGSTTLPLTVGFMYNSATSKWRCIASA